MKRDERAISLADTAYASNFVVGLQIANLKKSVLGSPHDFGERTSSVMPAVRRQDPEAHL